MAARYQITDAVLSKVTVATIAGVLQVGSGATVAIKDLRGNNLTVYTTETGGTTTSNPVTADTFGRAEYWVDAPDYELAASGTVTSHTLSVRNSPHGTYNVKSYGAKGDGTTDDTVQIRATFAAAVAAGGGKVTGKPGDTYKVSNGDAAGSIASGTGVTTDFYGCTFDISGAASSFRLFTADGSVGTHYALTANTTAGGGSVSVTAGVEANFAAGDLVLLGSEAYYEKRTALYGAGTGQKLGEIKEVASTASGSIVFRDTLAGGYVDNAGATQFNYKTADTAFIAKITPVERVHYHGGKIIGTAGSGSGSQQGVQITFGRDCTVRDMRAKDVAYNGFGLLSCVDSHMDNVGGTGFWSTGTGYATFIGDGSQDCTAKNIVATRCRHAFTTVSSSGSYGPTRRVEVNGKCWYTINAGDAWDSHAAAEDITYDNCYSFASSEFGLNFEGSSCTVIGGSYNWSANIGISIHNETMLPSRFTVIGPSILRSGSHGIKVAPGTSTGCIADNWGIDVNAHVRHPAAVGIYVTGTASLQWTGAKASGTVDYSQSTTAAVYSQYIDYCSMDCVVTNIINSSVGMRQDNGNYGSIRGTTHGVAGSTGQGTYVKNATHIAHSITANSLAKGVQFDNTASSCVVDGGDLTGCTLPISLGTGTGHRIERSSTGADTVQTVATDANISFTNQTTPEHTIHTGTLTAARTITLSTSNAWKGMRYKITRSGGGAFNLNVGGVLLKALATNQWCEITFDGTAWVLSQFGSL